MKTNFFVLVTFVVFGFSLYSCTTDGDGEVSCTATETQIANEGLNLLGTALNYAFDPSQANCEAYRQSLENLLDLSEDYRSCIPTDSLSSYDSDVQEYQDEIDNLPC